MFYAHLDASDILGLSDIKEKIDAASKDALRDLSMAAHAHLIEQVQSKLRSTREKYLDALSFQQVSDDTFMITLDAKAMWIEEGIAPNTDMLEGLLNSPKAKTSKDGHKYIVVPFEHNKGPSKQTQAQQSLTATIREELKRRKIPYGKLEMDASGKPKTGLLHSFDIKDKPIKEMHAPGQGKGPIGHVMQGPTGIPLLKGIRVYQREIKDKATGKSKIVKSIMTFRVASSKQRGTGQWVHPGLEPKHFFEETVDWCNKLLDEQIIPKIFFSIQKTT